MLFWGLFLMLCVLWGLSTLANRSRILWAPGICRALAFHCCVSHTPRFMSFFFLTRAQISIQPRTQSVDLWNSLSGQVPPFWYATSQTLASLAFLNSGLSILWDLQALFGFPLPTLQSGNCLQLVSWSNHRADLFFFPLLSETTVLCWLASKVWSHCVTICSDFQLFEIRE